MRISVGKFVLFSWRIFHFLRTMIRKLPGKSMHTAETLWSIFVSWNKVVWTDCARHWDWKWNPKRLRAAKRIFEMKQSAIPRNWNCNWLIRYDKCSGKRRRCINRIRMCVVKMRSFIARFAIIWKRQKKCVAEIFRLHCTICSIFRVVIYIIMVCYHLWLHLKTAVSMPFRSCQTIHSNAEEEWARFCRYMAVHLFADRAKMHLHMADDWFPNRCGMPVPHVAPRRLQCG